MIRSTLVAMLMLTAVLLGALDGLTRCGFHLHSHLASISTTVKVEMTAGNLKTALFRRPILRAVEERPFARDLQIMAFEMSESSLDLEFALSGAPPDGFYIFPGSTRTSGLSQLKFIVGFPLWAAWGLAAIYPTWALLVGARRKRFRRKRGYCRTCGYNLTGNVSGRCPECGSDVVASTEPST